MNFEAHVSPLTCSKRFALFPATVISCLSSRSTRACTFNCGDRSLSLSVATDRYAMSTTLMTTNCSPTITTTAHALFRDTDTRSCHTLPSRKYELCKALIRLETLIVILFSNPSLKGITELSASLKSKPIDIGRAVRQVAIVHWRYVVEAGRKHSYVHEIASSFHG